MVYVCRADCSCQSEFSGQRLWIKVGGAQNAGLNKGSQAGKGLAGVAIGAAIYATSGLATAVLLNRQVRDYILANEPTRDWPVTNTGRDFPLIAREVQSALWKIVPAYCFSGAASATSS